MTNIIKCKLYYIFYSIYQNPLECMKNNFSHFMTTTPLAVAASRSMLSTPVPARPMTFMLGALSSTCRVTLVSERTIRPSCFWNTHQTKSSFHQTGYFFTCGRRSINRLDNATRDALPYHVCMRHWVISTLYLYFWVPKGQSAIGTRVECDR